MGSLLSAREGLKLPVNQGLPLNLYGPHHLTLDEVRNVGQYQHATQNRGSLKTLSRVIKIQTISGFWFPRIKCILM